MTASKKNINSYADEGLETYFEQIRQYPLLNYEQEIELSKKIQSGDKLAEKKMIESNLRLVVKIARQYITPGISFLDLIQEGNLGLITAAAKYDFNHQVRFSTYASWWIKQAITRAIANKRRAIRLPHRKEDALRRVKTAFNTLSQKLMRSPSLKELSVAVEMPLHEVFTIMNVSNTPASMDSDLGEDLGNLHDLCQDFTYSPEQLLDRKYLQEEINDMLHQLEERERTVLESRFEIGGAQKQTLKLLSDELGVSPETVRQIEMRAIKKIKNLGNEIISSI